MYDVFNLPPRIAIGRLGEANYTTLEFDVAEFVKNYPGATVQINYKRPDGYVYTVPTTSYADGVLTWTVSDVDLIAAGNGRAEIELKHNDTVIGKSDMFVVTVANAVMGSGDTPVPPVPPTPGTTDYNDLDNKPSINGHTLIGHKTSADLGIEYVLTEQDKQDIADIVLSELTEAETQGV